MTGISSRVEYAATAQEARLIDRPRLKWVATEPAQVSLLHAPIGMGKSVLLNQWFRAASGGGHKCLWLKLRDVHRGRSEFCAALLAGLGQRDGGTISPEDMLHALMTAGLSHIFLDDADALTGSEAETFLAELVRRSTSIGFHLAMRRPLRLPKRILLRGDRLHILNGSALAFTPYEIRRLLGQSLISRTADRLIDGCEGWPLALAMLHRRPCDDPRALKSIASFCRLSGFQDLIDVEIGSACRGKDTAFLAVLGISAKVDVPFLNDIREAGDSATILDRIAHLLPLRFEEEDGLVRAFSSPVLHHLLRRRFDALGSSARCKLAAKASDVARDRGEFIHAIDFSLLARQPERAVEIAETAGPMRLMMIYGVPPLQALVRRLPAQLLARSPRLQLLETLLFAKQGLLAEARSMLDTLTTAPGHKIFEEHASTALDALFARTQVSVYSDGRWEDGFQRSAQFELRRDAAYAGWVRLCSGILAHERGELRKADLEFQKADAVFRSFRAKYQLCYMKLHRAHVQIARGLFTPALRLLGDARSETSCHYDFDAGLQAAIDVGRTSVLLETRPDHVRPDELASAMMRLEESEGWFEPYACGYIYQARSAYACNGFESVLDLTSAAQRLLSRQAITHIRGILTTLRAYYALLAEDQNAEIYVNNLEALPEDTASFWRERHLRSMIDAMRAERHQDVRRAIDDLTAYIEGSIRAGLAPAALDASLHRLSIMDRHNFDREFRCDRLNAGIALASSLKAIGTIDRWRNVFDNIKDVDEGGLSSPAREYLNYNRLRWNSAQSQVQKLTTKELAVLDQLTLGLSNKAVGRSLNISENTIKFHLKHIFQKLGVEDRGAAVRIARSTGLV